MNNSTPHSYSDNNRPRRLPSASTRVKTQPSRVIFSGNSTRYSTRRLQVCLGTSDLKVASGKFKNLSHVIFGEDGSVNLYHDGRFTDGVRSDLRKVGDLLEDGERLIALGIDNTRQRPLLIVIENHGVSIIPFRIRMPFLRSTRQRRLVESLAASLPIDTIWINRSVSKAELYPKTLDAVDRGNAGYRFFQAGRKK